MKVLHILEMSLPEIAGYSIRTKGIVEAQAKMGLKPFCITSFRQKNNTPEIEIINNIKYYRSGNYKPILNFPIVKLVFKVNRFANKIQTVVKKEKIDILHAHSPIICGMAAEKVGRKYSLPVIYEIRAFWEDAAVSSGTCNYGDLRYKAARTLETLVCKRADKIVTICEGIKNELINRNIHPAKISVVPNGISTQDFSELSKSVKLIKDNNLEGFFVLGFIGSFFKFEGVELLVYLMNELRDAQIKLILVGEGETFDKIKQMTNELCLNDRIILTGSIPHKTVRDYYSVMDVLIYPRYSEKITEYTTPLKPLEAMAMHKNIIISDVGGLKELVPDGCGEIFKAGDVNDLKHKVIKLKMDSKLREEMKRNVEIFVKSRDWNNVVLKYKDIYM